MADKPEPVVLQQLHDLRTEIDSLAARLEAIAAERRADFSELRDCVGRIEATAARLTAEYGEFEEREALILGRAIMARWRDRRRAYDVTDLAHRITALEVHTGLVPTS